MYDNCPIDTGASLIAAPQYKLDVDYTEKSARRSQFTSGKKAVRRPTNSERKYKISDLQQAYRPRCRDEWS